MPYALLQTSSLLKKVIFALASVSKSPAYSHFFIYFILWDHDLCDCTYIAENCSPTLLYDLIVDQMSSGVF